MLLGPLGILAPAARGAADIVLLGETAGVDRPQSQQLRFDPLEALLKLCARHADIITVISA